jgi:hypothetical protein
MDVICYEVLGCLKERQSHISEVSAKVIDNVALQFLKIVLSSVGPLYTKYSKNRR